MRDTKEYSIQINNLQELSDLTSCIQAKESELTLLKHKVLCFVPDLTVH